MSSTQKSLAELVAELEDPVPQGTEKILQVRISTDIDQISILKESALQKEDPTMRNWMILLVEDTTKMLGTLEK